LPIVSIDDGIQIDRSDPQEKKAHSPRRETEQSAPKVTRDSWKQYLKQKLGIASTDPGIQIACTEVRENAVSPRIKARDLDSNSRPESVSQRKKHDLEIVSIDEGMQIDRSDEHLSNADSPRLAIWQPNSNATFERRSQLQKHRLGSASIDEGIQKYCGDNAFEEKKPPRPRVETRTT
jgi:hypothetical protein